MSSLLSKEKLRDLKTLLRFGYNAVFSPYSPLLAQMVVTRRCNLACGYCNEYDDFSPPVETKLLLERIKHLAALGTGSLTLTGGEPLLHPDLDILIKAARDEGMIVTTISNAFRLSKDWIDRLNRAGLQGMQVSIDNLKPDDVSMKSLSSVKKRLALLAEHAKFKVNINSVLGVTGERTSDVIEIAKTAAHFGFQHSVSLVHNEHGQAQPLTPLQMQVYRTVTRISPSLVHTLNYYLFQKNLMKGKPNDWKCRAGARYLYITEDGKVHWCSQKRGKPAIDLLAYGKKEIQKEFHTKKGCAPYCTLSCVHQMSMFDRFRK